MLTILAIAIVALIIVLCVKFKGFRYSVFTILFVVVLALGTISGLNINKYYNAEGGIFGYIGQVFSSNQGSSLIEKSDITIKIDNVTLEKQADNTYTANIILNEQITLDDTKNYEFFINGFNADVEEYSFTHFKGSFTQFFYLDKELTETSAKTIKFAMYMYTNYINIDLYVGDDVDAVMLFNSYFKKNGCNIQIKSIDCEVVEYVSVVVHHFEDIVYQVPKGSAFIIPNYNKFENGYWTLNGKKIEGSIIVNEDIELFADYSVLDISDEALIAYVSDRLGITPTTPSTGGDAVEFPKTFEELNIEIYKLNTGDEPEANLTFYEIADFNLSYLAETENYVVEYDETLTPRQFGELMYNFALTLD